MADTQLGGDATDIAFAVGTPAPLEVNIVNEKVAIVKAYVPDTIRSSTSARGNDFPTGDEAFRSYLVMMNDRLVFLSRAFVLHYGPQEGKSLSLSDTFELTSYGQRLVVR